MLTKPPVKRIDLHFPLGMEVTARNLKGVTIKDALDAIHKSYKKRVRLKSTSHRGSSRTHRKRSCPVCSLPRVANLYVYRPMTSSTRPTSLASSGIRKSRGRDWLSTSRRSLPPVASAPAVVARRRRTRRRESKRPPPTLISVPIVPSTCIVWPGRVRCEAAPGILQ